jgi:FNIP Repeat
MLTHLILGENFNQPVDNLPSTLTYLTTGHAFNQPVDKLPPTLTHLKTGHTFNQPVDKLPPTLTHLKTGIESINQLINSHPHSFTLILEIVLTNQLINSHPHSLTSKLDTNQLINSYPHSLFTLTHLTTGKNSTNQLINSHKTHSPHNLSFPYDSQKWVQFQSNLLIMKIVCTNKTGNINYYRTPTLFILLKTQIYFLLVRFIFSPPFLIFLSSSCLPSCLPS